MIVSIGEYYPVYFNCAWYGGESLGVIKVESLIDSGAGTFYLPDGLEIPFAKVRGTYYDINGNVQREKAVRLVNPAHRDRITRWKIFNTLKAHVLYFCRSIVQFDDGSGDSVNSAEYVSSVYTDRILKVVDLIHKIHEEVNLDETTISWLGSLESFANNSKHYNGDILKIASRVEWDIGAFLNEYQD